MKTKNTVPPGIHKAVMSDVTPTHFVFTVQGVGEIKMPRPTPRSNHTGMSLPQSKPEDIILVHKKANLADLMYQLNSGSYKQGKLTALVNKIADLKKEIYG
jgi:hypothetical protein